MPTVIQGPRCNRRVTCSTSPSNDRSESAVVINPQNPYHLVGASKKFISPHTYDFSLACYFSFDGGQSWDESPSLSLIPSNVIHSGTGKNDDWVGISDPALAFDDIGNVYLFALPFGSNWEFDLRGMAVYKSTDGGKTWSAPNHIHNVLGDDKQWCVGDTNPLSLYYGRVYGCWDSGNLGTSSLCFARSLDHGATWKSIGVQPAGTPIPGVSDSGSPEINVMRDGTVFIVWVNNSGQIKFTKSVNGGDTFSTPAIAVSGITNIPPKLYPGKFRTYTFPTACAGNGQNIVVAWADYREGISRIYYRRSTNGGSAWQGPTSGSPMVTGAAGSASNQQDFHPQIISTPAGEIGCAFYEFGPNGPGEFPPYLIDVYLAVSTDNGASFPNRVKVTDQAWDPTVDEVWAHDDQNTTFIGDYFGIDASRLGFYPFWTDTRTGVQEIFTSRISLYPADVYIRDSSTDVGNLPSPGNHWEFIDLIVKRQPDGDVSFVNEDLLRDGVTDHYIYAKVNNSGPNAARNVMLSAKIANWPPLNALPGTEFRYPQDWYKDDWGGAPLHTDLGNSAPINIPFPTGPRIIGPVIWPASMIPDPNTWHHPCLLAEVLADNNDSAGNNMAGYTNSIPIPAEGDKNACNYGSYFWGSNNAAQRNLSYAPLTTSALSALSFSFIAGNLKSNAKLIELIIDKGRVLAEVPMRLKMEKIILKEEPGGLPKDDCYKKGQLVIIEETTLQVKCGDCVIGEIIAKPGTMWQCACTEMHDKKDEETVYSIGALQEGKEWKLLTQRSLVGFNKNRGEIFKMTLTFTIPQQIKDPSGALVRIIQRNDKKVITGGVSFVIPGKNYIPVDGIRSKPKLKSRSVKMGKRKK
jgi:hypothetical protein